MVSSLAATTIDFKMAAGGLPADNRPEVATGERHLPAAGTTLTLPPQFEKGAGTPPKPARAGSYR